jgi:hypothetical protein
MNACDIGYSLGGKLADPQAVFVLALAAAFISEFMFTAAR